MTTLLTLAALTTTLAGGLDAECATVQAWHSDDGVTLVAGEVMQDGVLGVAGLHGDVVRTEVHDAGARTVMDVDTNADGKPDQTVFAEADLDGRLIALAVDLDRDGTIDRAMEARSSCSR